jgi:protein-ribulosamine 3-kinase
MNSTLASAILEALSDSQGGHLKLLRTFPISGGSGLAAWRLQCNTAEFFIKIQIATTDDYFLAERSGLQELWQASQNVSFKNSHLALRIPRVFAHGRVGNQAYLAMEYLELRKQGEDERLGQALATLHHVQSKTHGWSMNNTLGPTPQPNTPCEDWMDFFCGEMTSSATENNFHDLKPQRHDLALVI